MSEPTRTRPLWPPQALGPTKSETRYAQIYETAARLFHQKGYASTSIQDLASAVGLQKGSLYHYIDSKEDLLFAISDYAHNFFISLVHEVNTADLSPLDTIREALRLHAEFAAEHFHITAIFYRDRSALSADRQSRIVATRDEYENALRRLIREGQAVGQIAGDMDPKMTVFGILGMVNWINQWYDPNGSFTPAEIGEQFSALGARALRPGTQTYAT